MRSRVIQQSFAEAPSWVVLRMAQNRDCYSSIGECEGCKRWKSRVIIWCVLVGVVGFFLGLEGCSGVWGGERLGREGFWERRAQTMVQEFNLSKTQLQALTVLLSSSEREISERMEGPKTISLSCLIEELCSEKKQQSIDMDGDALLDVNCSCTNSPLEGGSSEEKIVPYSTQSIIGGQIISNSEEFMKSTDLFLDQVTMNRVKILVLILVGMVLSFRMLYHVRTFNFSNERKHQKQVQTSNTKTGAKRKKLLLLGVLLGLLTSVWIFFCMSEDIIKRRMDTLTTMCDERARMLQDQFNVSMNHVQALAILVSTFHHGKNPSAIDQKTFKEYTARTAFERPLTSGVAYALKVMHSEREQFEQEHGVKIKKMREDQSPVQDDFDPERLDASPVQEEYAPVIFSQDTVSHIVSVDMMSGKDDRDNIIRSRTTGKGALTAPFNLLKYNYLGVVLTFAVYKSELPPNATPQERTDATIGQVEI